MAYVNGGKLAETNVRVRQVIFGFYFYPIDSTLFLFFKTIIAQFTFTYNVDPPINSNPSGCYMFSIAGIEFSVLLMLVVNCDFPILLPNIWHTIFQRDAACGAHKGYIRMYAEQIRESFVLLFALSLVWVCLSVGLLF